MGPAGIYNTDEGSGQVVTTSPLIYFRNVPATGFYLTSSVFPDDPTRTVLTLATVMEEFYESIVTRSSNIVLVRGCARGRAVCRPGLWSCCRALEPSAWGRGGARLRLSGPRDASP